MMARVCRAIGPQIRQARWSSSATPGFKGVPRETADAVVIGAGVVGLAVARALAMCGREVLVVESASTFGTGTSSRNSEVVHAGIYYQPGSLKAMLCVRGRELLYKYCEEHEIHHKKIGKLIVATGPAEIPKLKNLLKLGQDNGVEGLKMIEGSESMQMEPELYCLKALFSPWSGIVDSHSFMLSLLGESEEKGATISFNTSVFGGYAAENGICLYTTESRNLECCDNITSLEPQLIVVPKLVINSAGLGALPLAKNFCGSHHVIMHPYYARGCYFTLSTKFPPFSHLIYPIPEDGGLGVHVTLDLDGNVKFGPDVEWIADIDDKSVFLNWLDYSVDSNRSSKFYPEIRKYYPNLKDGSLVAGYSGIRPKLSGPKEPPMDFVMQDARTHGVRGLINLFGIESPGLTSSLAIAEHVLHLSADSSD